MSSQDELENETNEQDTQLLSGDENVAEVAPEGEAAAAAEGGPPTKKRRIRKEPVVWTREPGKSLLPFSRVQKIIKADKVRTRWYTPVMLWN